MDQGWMNDIFWWVLKVVKSITKIIYTTEIEDNPIYATLRLKLNNRCLENFRAFGEGLRTNLKGSGGRASIPRGIFSGSHPGWRMSNCIMRFATSEKATLCTILYPMQDLLPMEKGWKWEGLVKSPWVSKNLSGLYFSGCSHSSSDMFKLWLLTKITVSLGT